MQGKNNLEDSINKIKESKRGNPEQLSTSEDEVEEKTGPSETKDQNPLSTNALTPINDDYDDEDPRIRENLAHSSATVRSKASRSKPQKVIPTPSRVNHMSQWKISFSGAPEDLSIERFLFRVKHYAMTYEVPFTELVDEIGVLLTGAAANWYWCHIERNPNLKWYQLECDFLERFQDRKSDHNIRRSIESRKQRLKESFRDFYNDILALSLQFRHPLEDSEILHLLRRNMRIGLQVALADRAIDSIPELVRRCLAIEDTWKRTGYDAEAMCSRRTIHEYTCDKSYTSSPSDCSGSDPNVSVNAIQLEGKQRQNIRFSSQPMTNVSRNSQDNNLLVCWNCSNIGHTYKYCVLDITHRFCFGCGRSGIFMRNCFKCSGNKSPRYRSPGNTTPRITMIPRPNMEDQASNTDAELTSRPPVLIKK